MRTCMHGDKQSLFLVSRVDSPPALGCRVSCCYKWSTGASACMSQPLPLLCAGQCDTSMSLIEGLFQASLSRLVCRPLVLTCRFCPHKSKLRNCGRLQNALRRRVPTMPHPPLPRLNPMNRDEGSCQPDSSSAPSSHVPPTWLNMTNSASQNKPKRGSLVQRRPPTCASLALCWWKWSAAPISARRTHPPQKTNTSSRPLCRLDVSEHKRSCVFNWY